MRPGSVDRRIRDLRREGGAVLCVADLADVTNPQNAATQLARLAARGCVERLLRGIYWAPPEDVDLAEDVELSGDTATDLPEPSAVARALARSNRWTIAPQGALALALLGLPGGDPAAATFASSGPYAEYDYRGQRIAFRHVADRYLNGLSETTRLVAQALRSLGPDGATGETVRQIASRLTQREADELAEEAIALPVWMRDRAAEVRSAREELGRRRIEEAIRTQRGRRRNQEAQARAASAVDDLKQAWTRFFTQDLFEPPTLVEDGADG